MKESTDLTNRAVAKPLCRILLIACLVVGILLTGPFLLDPPATLAQGPPQSVEFVPNPSGQTAMALRNAYCFDLILYIDGVSIGTVPPGGRSGDSIVSPGTTHVLRAEAIIGDKTAIVAARRVATGPGFLVTWTVGPCFEPTARPPVTMTLGVPNAGDGQGVGGRCCICGSGEAPMSTFCSLISGELPPGLSLSCGVEPVPAFPDEGVSWLLVSGTPTQIGTFPFVVLHSTRFTSFGACDEYIDDVFLFRFTIIVTSGCQLNPVPAFSWTQFQAPWGGNNYDHSYATTSRYQDPNVTRISPTGRLELVVGRDNYIIPLSPDQNNVGGLRDAINALGVGVNAVLRDNGQGSGSNRYFLSLYNARCLAMICPPGGNTLELRLNPGDAASNILRNRTISEVGCALTTLSMAANFAGGTVFISTPSFIAIEPGSLNEFMSNTLPGLPAPGGVFTSEGDVDFINSTRLIGLNSGLPLKFDGSGSGLHSILNPEAVYQKLDDALCGATPHPVIVGVRLRGRFPGHFVLVIGKEERTDGSLPAKYFIADPAGRGTSLDDYTGFGSLPEFVIRGIVKDPPDDLSELNAVVGDNADVMLIDEDGRRAGFDRSAGIVLLEIPLSGYFEDALDDDVSGEPATGISHSVQLLKPSERKYNALVRGLQLGLYTLSLRAYSQDGSSQRPIVIQGIAGVGSTSSFDIQFSPVAGSNPTIKRVVTFQSTIEDIHNAFQSGLIDNQGVADSLARKIEAAAEAVARGQARTSKNILEALKNELNAQTGRHIAALAARVLLEDADSLLSQLPR